MGNKDKGKGKGEKPIGINKFHKDDKILDKAADRKKTGDKAVDKLIKWARDVDSE
jgi:hypothetical protein